MSDDRRTVAPATRAPQGASRPSRPQARRKPVFDKEHATLWLLTLSLGLGVGAVFRIAERSGTATAPGSQLAVQQPAQLPGFGSAQSATGTAVNQRVAVLPQRVYGARGTTRMS